MCGDTFFNVDRYLDILGIPTSIGAASAPLMPVMASVGETPAITSPLDLTGGALVAASAWLASTGAALLGLPRLGRWRR